jgi:hypothetical protein
LIVEQTGTESLTITADDNLLPYIKADMKGNTLELGIQNWMTSLRPTADIVYNLTVKKLEDIRVSGSGRVTAKGLNADRLNIRISGSGEVLAQGGDVTDLDLRISGSGDYRGAELKSKTASLRVSGSGSATVAASEKLNADISGSGSVDYIGDPIVRQHVTGSGSVRRR